MKSILSVLVLVSFASNAFAMCGSHFSSAEKAGEKVKELLKSGQAQQIKIIAVPKNIMTPCFTGEDQFYIELDGKIQNDGDRNG